MFLTEKILLRVQITVISFWVQITMTKFTATAETTFLSAAKVMIIFTAVMEMIPISSISATEMMLLMMEITVQSTMTG